MHFDLDSKGAVYPFWTQNVDQAQLNTVMWNRALDSKNTRW